MSVEDYMFESGDWFDWSCTYNRYHKRSRRYKQYDSFDYSLSYSYAERRAYGYRRVCAFYKKFLNALPTSLKEKAFIYFLNIICSIGKCLTQKIYQYNMKMLLDAWYLAWPQQKL